jgi:hypothetical protein
VNRRRSSPLKPQLNQIRTWAQQGRTDAWIAHHLETTPDAIAEFRGEHGLGRGTRSSAATPVTPEVVAASIEEEGPRAAASEEAPAAAGEPEKRRARRGRRGAGQQAAEATAAAPEAKEEAPVPETPVEPAPRSRRRRSRGDAAPAEPAAATVYAASIAATVALALDASVVNDPVFVANWAGAGSLVAEVTPDAIVVRRR